MHRQTIYDCIIIGGSYSGMAAAMSLGRSLKKVLLMDSGQACNRQTPQSHNFLTQDGVKPSEITAIARKQIAHYSTIECLDEAAITGQKTALGFEVTSASGQIFSAKKLLFATGIQDIMPNIAGFAECWGISAIHCPYCHGYEFKQQKTALLANAEKALHLASLISNLTDQLTIFTAGKANFSTAQFQQLHKNKIQIVEKEIKLIQHERGQLNHLVLADGETVAFQALYAALKFVQSSDIPADLGCHMTDTGYIKVDASQKTSIPGVFACGDNSSSLRSVSNAVATGSLAGAMINMELTYSSF